MTIPRVAAVPCCLGVLLGIWAIAVSAQIPGMPSPPAAPAAPATGIIAGQVVDGDTGRPVSGATVVLSVAPPGMANVTAGGAIPMDAFMSMDISSVLTSTQQALTNGQGQFAFTNLARGSFSLQATKPGWGGGLFGQLRPDGAPTPLVLGADARMGTVSLRMWKNAALTGIVVDEAGEPIIGLTVRALRRTWMAGHARFAAAGSGQTDDRGVYRIAALRPGEYVAVITQTPATAPIGASPAPPDPSMIQSMIASGGAGGDVNAMLANVMSMMAGPGAGGGLRRGEWQMHMSGVMGGRLVPPSTAGDGRMMAYRTTFHPNATAAAEAAAVTLRSGEERSGVDFHLRPVPVVQVSGVLTGLPEGFASLPVRLIPTGTGDLASDSGFEAATSVTRANGAFMFLGVPAGQYTLRAIRTPPANFAAMAAARGAAMPAPTMIQNAQGGRAISMGAMGNMNIGMMMMPVPPAIPTEPTLWADVPVSVVDTDLADVNVALRPGFRVTGRAEFEGSSERPAADRLQRLPILLERADTGGITPNPIPGMGATQGGQFNERGEFTTYGVVPGKYFVRVAFTLAGWTLKSAELGGRDVADVPFDMENGDVSGVVLTFTDRPSDLSGTVRDPQNAASVNATVIVFPSQPGTWTDFGSSPRRLRTAKVGPDGRYLIAPLPAGDYLVAVVRGDAGNDWQDPGFLRTLSATAMKITIADGEKKVADLAVAR
jgi:hypothetical protein